MTTDTHESDERTEEQKALREAVARAMCIAFGFDPDSKIKVVVADAPPQWVPQWTLRLNAADAAISVALERAAKVCEPKADEAWSYHWREAGQHIAAAIRALIPASGDATS